MATKRIREFSYWLVFGLLVLSLAGCVIITPEPPGQDDPVPEEVVVPPAFPTLEEMVGISPAIFSGTVVEIRYGKHKESPYPFTFVRFANLRLYRQDTRLPSQEGGTLEISHVGGMDEDNTILEVSRQPEFELGQRYLVFLRGGGWRLGPVPGGDQGVFLLYGPSDEEALVLNLQGEPLSGFKDGYPVYSQPAPIDEGKREEPEQPLQEREIDSEQALELGIRSPELLDSEEVEKLEVEMSEEISSEEEALEDRGPEPDQLGGYRQIYGDVLTLSEFVAQIEALTGKTLGQYPAFEQVYFSPVPTSAEGTLKTPGK